MTVDSHLAQFTWDSKIVAEVEDLDRMRRSRSTLERVLETRPVYGVSRGFGPLVGFAAGDALQHGTGLIDHLSVGQGVALPPAVVRTMVGLRLRGMTRGHSAVLQRTWSALAEQWNAGFTPIVPREGSLSASGDLVPLAHAAQAAAGLNQVWRRGTDGWRPAKAADELRRLGLPVVSWDARSALAFVNGTSASLAQAMHNHTRLAALVRAVAAATARLVTLLGASDSPYSDALSAARCQPGQRVVAGWIRAELHGEPADRALQESYSLRCAPQVLGAVLDQLRLQGEVLCAEAVGCSDNPMVLGSDVLHGGNFHAAPVAMASEQLGIGVHQVAYLAERQLALVLDPHRNGGLPPFLTPDPGRQSGLAGVQIAATSHLGAIRQRGYPASFTPVPTNLDNQDHVPMALNSGNAVFEMLDRAWWIAGSLFLALNQLGLLRQAESASPPWRTLATTIPLVEVDRQLDAEVAAAARQMERHFLPDELIGVVVE